MTRTMTIYAVVSSKGSYDSYHEWIEKCFTDKIEAMLHARHVDETHRYESRIPDDVMDEVEEHWYDEVYDPKLEKFCRDNDIPTQEDMSDVPEWMCSRTEEQNKMVSEYVDEIETDYDHWCIKYLAEHHPEYTEQDYWDYIEAVEHSFDDWHDCKIRELELVIADDTEL